MRRALVAGVLVAISLSCSGQEGDPPSDRGIPPPSGKDLHIRDVADPGKPEHKNYLVDGNSVTISGAIVTAVDTFDETNDGKSKGTIYVQDLGSKEPYSGTSLYSPSFVPGNLKVSANDVIDLRGPYTEAGNIGTAKFTDGAVLPQLSKPTATFRFEVKQPPPPVLIKDIHELENFTTGRKYLNMVVRVENVTPQEDIAGAATSGRLAVDLTPAPSKSTKCDDPFPKSPTLTNELFDLGSLNIPQKDPASGAPTVLKSVTGIVTFFCNLHISPRNANDIER